MHFIDDEGKTNNDVYAQGTGNHSTPNELTQSISGEPEVSLVISRRTYRSGDILCGTVRLYLREDDENDFFVTDSGSIHSVTDAPSEASTTIHDNLSGSRENGFFSKEHQNGNTTEAQLECEKMSRDESFQRMLREQYFKSATIHVAGHCRVDTRWHPSASAELEQLYGKTHPLLIELPPETVAYTKDIDILQHFPSRAGSKLQQNSVVVCHYATNCLQLLNLQERFEPYRGKPLRLTLKNLKDPLFYDKLKTTDWKSTTQASEIDESDAMEEDAESMHHRHLYFTFTVHLPPELPPTIQATCCRYMYSAVLSVTLRDGRVLTAISPFKLLSCAKMAYDRIDRAQSHSSHISCIKAKGGGIAGVGGGARIMVGECEGEAHSNYDPCYVSTSTFERKRQIQESSMGLCSSLLVRDEINIRITNEDGMPTCIMSVLGSKIMLPGTRMLLQFRFKSLKDQLTEAAEGRGEESAPLTHLQCLQICVCIRGEEVAVGHKGAGTGRERYVRQYFIQDTGHAYVYPETDVISMHLGLPLDAPCSVVSDIVEISTTLHLEFTVQKRNYNRDSYLSPRIKPLPRHLGKLETLKLDLPIEVVHGMPYEDDDDQDGVTSKLREEVSGFVDEAQTNKRNDELSNDILNDLTLLTIRQIEKGRGLLNETGS